MCGIVGVTLRGGVKRHKYGSDKVRRLFETMLVEAQARGRAATGMVLLNHKFNVGPKAYVLRSPIPAEDFVKTENYINLMQEKFDEDSFSIIGHTRAVSGNNAVAEDNSNNHPHVCGQIIGVHNGRISNDNELWEQNKEHMQPKSRCDSEVIFSLINRHLDGDKTEDAAVTAIQELAGWFAVAFVNALKPYRMHLLRDETTPLELAWWPNQEVAIFASSYDYIKKGLKNCDNNVSSYEMEHKRYDVKPMQLLTLDTTIKGARDELFIASRSVKGNIAAKRQLIEANRESFNITQGNSIST